VDAELLAEVRRLSEEVEVLTARLGTVTRDLFVVQQQYEVLRLAHNAHVHGGVTAGAANSGASTAAGQVVNPMVLQEVG
jgi:hypothetical protein